MSETHGFVPGCTPWKYHQKILNDTGARPDAEERPPLPVRARIVWKIDGIEWLDGEATRFDPRDRSIFVEIHDIRSECMGVFLHPDDVIWPGKA